MKKIIYADRSPGEVEANSKFEKSLVQNVSTTRGKVPEIFVDDFRATVYDDN